MATLTTIILAVIAITIAATFGIVLGIGLYRYCEGDSHATSSTDKHGLH